MMPLRAAVDRRQTLLGLAATGAAAALPARQAAAATRQGAVRREFTSLRHRTSYLESGPADGPLLFFIHGWPDLGLTWRQQVDYFGAQGWHCIAPDMRGSGGSAVPTRVSDYAVPESVADMLELHDALGGKPAVWVGHSLGSTVVWSIATQHPERCRGVINMTVPYIARGNAVATLIPLVNRELYPLDRYPYGQWDYMVFYVENFTKAVRSFEARPEQTIDMFYGRGSPDALATPTVTANIRAQGGWFPPGSQPLPRETLLPPDDHRAWLAAFARTGFSGSTAWYLNDDANMRYAAQAPAFGRIALPTLFVHALWDPVCDTTTSRLADPMRQDCLALTEVKIAAGHTLMLEQPEQVNRAMETWLTQTLQRA